MSGFQVIAATNDLDETRLIRCSVKAVSNGMGQAHPHV